MAKRWLLMNEIIFAVYRDRRGGTTVTLQNVAAGDKAFLSAVGRLIEVWMSDKEAGR